MGGVKGRKITRKREGMYVRGVAVHTGRFVLSISIINNNPEACVFALFASCSTQYSAALPCAAGKLSIWKHTPHGTCCFFVDACRLQWRLLRRCLEQLTIYKYCPLFLSVRYAVFQIANLGDYTRSFFGDIPPKKRCPGRKPLFLHPEKVPGIPGAKNDLAW